VPNLQQAPYLPAEVGPVPLAAGAAAAAQGERAPLAADA